MQFYAFLPQKHREDICWYWTEPWSIPSVGHDIHQCTLCWILSPMEAHLRLATDCTIHNCSICNIQQSEWPHYMVYDIIV